MSNLPVFKSLAESQAEREAFFAAAWAQKAARERGDPLPKVAREAEREAARETAKDEAVKAKQKRAVEDALRARKLSEVLGLSSDDDD